MKALLTLTAMLLLSACSEGGSTRPLTPTPIPAPATPTSSSEGWSVAIQTTANTGPAFCIFTPSVGAVFKGDYDLVWHGDSVSFVPPDPFDWSSFKATLAGLDFTATNPPVASIAGMCTHYLQASTLAGTFSADKTSFTAVENWYFTLDSGDVRTVTFSWSGTRR